MLSKIRNIFKKIVHYRHIFLIALVMGCVVIAYMIYLRLNGYVWLSTIGFEGKTFWDWLELLVIPATLAVVAYLLDKLKRKSDRDINLDNQQEAAFENYLDTISEFLLDKGLRTSKPEDDVRVVARLKTYLILHRLDIGRKSKLIHFLSDAGLVTSEIEAQPIISLKYAFLNYVELYGTNLSGADLEFAHLWGAKICCNLNGANLKHATLRGADMWDTALEGANLKGAEYDEKTIWPDGFDKSKTGAILRERK